MLYEVVYQSIAGEDFTVRELTELMDHSRKFNNENNITGCLIYHNRTFIQALEGDKTAVTALFDKIKVDTRHFKVRKSWESDINERGFGGWSMSLMNLERYGLASVFSDFLDTGEFSYDIQGILTTSKSILKTMKDNL